VRKGQQSGDSIGVLKNLSRDSAFGTEVGDADGSGERDDGSGWRIEEDRAPTDGEKPDGVQ
jgi:hypothetical protein